MCIQISSGSLSVTIDLQWFCQCVYRYRVVQLCVDRSPVGNIL